jgi:hypothetical protein
MDDPNTIPHPSVRARPPLPDPSTPDGRDVLISRIIDAEAGAEDWRAFRRLAEADPGVWRDLDAAQQQHELLCEGVHRASARADAVDLPVGVDDRGLQRRLQSVGRWGGWAAAAAVLLAWSTGQMGGPGAPLGGGSVNQAGLLGAGTALHDATPDEALERYLDAGRHAGLVVGEVPDRLVIETTPRSDGSVEVVYLRQIIERRVTDRVYREAVDDTGRAVPVPIPAVEIQRVRAF